jgi:hypothetical protein
MGFKSQNHLSLLFFPSILLSSVFGLDLVIPPSPTYAESPYVSCCTQMTEPFHLLELHNYIAKALLKILAREYCTGRTPMAII